MSKLAQALAAAAWAAVLTPEQRSRVERDTFSREMPEGSYVCRKGDTASHWNGVLIGLIKIAAVSLSGKLTTFSGVPAGGWFGEGSICKEEAWRFDAIALRDSEVAYMPRSTFLWLLENNTQFARFLLVHVNERLGQAMGLIECGRLLGPDGRVAVQSDPLPGYRIGAPNLTGRDRSSCRPVAPPSQSSAQAVAGEGGVGPARA